MSDLTITVDLGKLPAMLARGQSGEGVKAGIKAAALFIKGKAATYPPVRRRKQPFKTDKQRRAFFAKLKDGEITVPYRRGSSPGSERLAQRWTIEARDGGLSAVVGNNASYAPLVQSAKAQSFYHKGNWKTDAEIVKDHGPEAARIVRTTVIAHLNRT